MTFEGISQLRDGWDGGSAKAPDPETLAKARMMESDVRDHFPSYPAEFVPCEDGGVQVEWHGDGWDAELWIARVSNQESKP